MPPAEASHVRELYTIQKDGGHLKHSHTKQFCKNGHDTFLCGRTQGGNCQECMRVSNADPGRKIAARNLNFKRAGTLNQDGTPFTMSDYNYQFQIQGGRCKGCLKHQSEFKKALAADHSHATGKFRGLLCYLCNTALGSINDSVSTAERLTKYLKDNYEA